MFLRVSGDDLAEVGALAIIIRRMGLAGVRDRG